MKNIITCLIMVSGICVFCFQTRPDKESKAPQTKFHNGRVAHKSVGKEAELTVVTKENGLTGLLEAPTVGYLENKFSGLSEAELSQEIQKNNLMESKAQLIEKANAGMLNERTSMQMLTFIRVNKVLNQILLNRQIEALENEIL